MTGSAGARSVAFTPVYRNPYQHLLADALADAGVTVELHEGLPSRAWLREAAGRVAVLHLHWLSGLYMARWRTPLQVARFLDRLDLARRLGIRLVWTAHNVLPHRRPLPPLHPWLRRRVLARADAVITHCRAGRDELRRRFGGGVPIHVVPIGSYAGVYPATVDRAAARRALGLGDDRFVLLALGNIAPYKGLERLAAAFRGRDRGDEVLLIAGRDRDPALVRRLRRLAAADRRLRVDAGEIPDGDMQLYLRSADVAVCPFERILGSSSVIVAMSYGLPVVAPAIGCLPELVTPDAGALYEAGREGALSAALDRVRSRGPAAMGATARAITDGLRWDDIARRTAAVYRSLDRGAAPELGAS